MKPNCIIMGLIVFSTLFLGACNEDDSPTVPVSANFQNTTLGLSESVEVVVSFSRPIATAGSIDIQVDAPTLSYGSDEDYLLEPGLENDLVTVPYEAGDQTLSFLVKAGSSLNIEEDKTITLSLMEDDNYVLGNDVSAVITLSENFVATEANMVLKGGGPEYPNQVFVDLSKTDQTTVDKYSWDLGFVTASGAYSVILNASANVMAQVLDGKQDIDAVVASDTLGFAANMYVSNYSNPNASNWVDDQSGDLSKTAISPISTTDSENHVYIIRRKGEGQTWKKIRVLQDGENYTVQHADIGATTHETITIAKNATHNFSYLSFENGVVDVAPSKDTWDIMYGAYTGRQEFTGLGVLGIAYNDYVTINRTDVSVAVVEEATTAYDNISTSNLSNLTFVSDNISVIGKSWRKLNGFVLELDTDIYYVLQDPDGNAYKLKFTKLKYDNGERGNPSIKYELL